MIGIDEWNIAEWEKKLIEGSIEIQEHIAGLKDLRIFLDDRGGNLNVAITTNYPKEITTIFRINKETKDTCLLMEYDKE